MKSTHISREETAMMKSLLECISCTAKDLIRELESIEQTMKEL